MLWYLCAGCGSVEEGTPREPGSGPRFENAGNLTAIRSRGFLRVLVPPREAGYLPRQGSPIERERELAEDFAAALRVEAEFVSTMSLVDLIDGIAEGRGDLAIGNLTVTSARSKRVLFSAPITSAREQLISRTGDTAPSHPADLSGRRLTLLIGSSFWDTARRLQNETPDLEIEAAAEGSDTESIFESVENGQIDLTIADSNFMAAAATWHPELAAAFDLGTEQMIAWAMPRGSGALRRAVDPFLARAHASPTGGSHFRDDLPGIEKRGVLRVLTRNSATSYFLWRGELLGFDYELIRRFARKRGLHLAMIVPPVHQDLVPWLLEGRGDLIAASLSASSERAEQDGITFTRAYYRTREVVVGRSDEPAFERVEDLRERDFAVRQSSSYWATLEELIRKGIGLRRRAAPESLTTERIIDRVGRGEYDLTIADEHILNIELSWRDDVKNVLDLDREVAYAWAVRPESTALRHALDAFIEKEYRSTFYNMTVRKYFRDPDKMRTHAVDRATRTGRISPWDELTRRWASHYGFDWRLVLAQMYQESRFDPKARSFAGARGLLQVMPRTAREFGYPSLLDPETGLQAGVEYLSWVRDRFESGLSPADRTWFALAAYNAGPGHVRDARRIAKKMGWDPARWFENVERAMLLKEQPEYYRSTRFGFARGSETVGYVRGIRDRYEAYLLIATPEPPSPGSIDAAAAQ